MPQLTGEPAGRITPLEDVINASEMDAMAQRKLDSISYALIAGGDRKAFERITLRPRLMINTTKLDLTLTLFGEKMFAPILVAPLSQQKRFHPEGEEAVAKGAAGAKAVVVGPNRSWHQATAGADVDAVRGQALTALSGGSKVVCLTATGWDWNQIDKFRQGLNAPVVLKGIMSADEARTAVTRGVQGIAVSNYVEHGTGGLAAPIEVLPAIAAAVAGKAAILIDGGFRRGSDILMALALGANAVMIGRPVLWGLAAYGAGGVQKVLELLQSELARDMAMCGRVDLKSVNASLVRVHRW